MPVDSAPNLNSKLYRCRQKRRFIMLIGNKDLTSLILRMNWSIRALYFLPIDGLMTDLPL